MAWTKKTAIGPASITKTAIGLASTAVLWTAYRRSKQLDLRGKCVLISGGSRGLGLEMAREFLKRGARIALLARDADELVRAHAELGGWTGRSESPGKSAALGSGGSPSSSGSSEMRAVSERSESPSHGESSGMKASDVIVVPCDIRDPDAAARAVGEVFSAFGSIDVLANVAGVIDVAPYEHQTPEDFRDSLDTHLWGPMHLIRNVVGRMKPGSRIVNISSIGGLVSVPHLLPYSVGKFALTGYSEGLSSELSKRGIYVTTVCPGLMRTGSHVKARFKGRHREEFAWFSASSGIPLASTSSRKAARKIIAACRMGKPFLILTPQARALHLFHALAPNCTARIMRLAARLLPDPTGEDGDRSREGWQSTSRAAPSILTRCADRAIDRNNELPEGSREAYFST